MSNQNGKQEAEKIDLQMLCLTLMAQNASIPIQSERKLLIQLGNVLSFELIDIIGPQIVINGAGKEIKLSPGETAEFWEKARYIAGQIQANIAQQQTQAMQMAGKQLGIIKPH